MSWQDLVIVRNRKCLSALLHTCLDNVDGALQLYLSGPHSIQSLESIRPPIQWKLRCLSSRLRRQRHEADSSPPPCSVDVENARKYTSIPPYDFMASCLFKRRDKYTSATFPRHLQSLSSGPTRRADITNIITRSIVGYSVMPREQGGCNLGPRSSTWASPSARPTRRTIASR